MKNILEFLDALAQNNNRDWMLENKPWYEQSRKEFMGFVDATLKDIQSFDSGFVPYQAKDFVFRINRDIRFSKDKSPYKTNFAAFFCDQGKKSFGPGYYIHLQPNHSFLAAGIYMPPSDSLQKIRQEIDYNPEPLLELFAAKNFSEVFPMLEGESLQRAPKNYSEDHPQIDWIKKKSFLVSTSFTDAEVLLAEFPEKVKAHFRLATPFIQYLKGALDA